MFMISKSTFSSSKGPVTHIAGCATDIGQGSIYGNWQGMRVGDVKDLRICHGSATDLLRTATVPQGQVCG